MSVRGIAPLHLAVAAVLTLSMYYIASILVGPLVSCDRIIPVLPITIGACSTCKYFFTVLRCTHLSFAASCSVTSGPLFLALQSEHNILPTANPVSCST